MATRMKGGRLILYRAVFGFGNGLGHGHLRRIFFAGFIDLFIFIATFSLI